jgi:hypothetical protein
LLCAVLLWPPVHHGLVRSLDLDPWSFFGWSMYAVPNLRLNVRAARLEADSAPDWNAISPALYGPMRAYALKRQHWGELLRPDALAEQIFAEHREYAGLLIRVRRWRIDRDSSRVQFRDRDYRYAPRRAVP